MEKEKKKWETPKLICLYRGRPEEAVLFTCKGFEATSTGAAGVSCSTTQPGGACKKTGTT